MNSLTKRIELLANIAIILVALLLGFVLAKRYIFSSPDANRAEIRNDIKAGTKISLPDFDWSGSNKHLVLVVQKGCHFCSESAPFYQRLVQETVGRKDIQLIAALPQDVNEGRQYLNDLGVHIDDVKQVNPSSFGVRGTPTLLLVDKTGLVTDVWAGKLQTDQEAAVISRLEAH
jgi:thioredoxin-related protein